MPGGEVVTALRTTPHDPGEHALQPVDLGAKPLGIYLQLVCALDEIGDGRLELIEFGEHARIIPNISSPSSEINRQFYSTQPDHDPPDHPPAPSSQLSSPPALTTPPHIWLNNQAKLTDRSTKEPKLSTDNREKILQAA